MTYRASSSLFVVLGLFTAFVASAQTPPAVVEPGPVTEPPPPDAPAAQVPVDSPAPVAPPPAQEAPLEPAPPPRPSAPPPPATPAASKAESKGPSEERCAQLMAQGNTAIAQAEGCGGGDQLIFAGSQISLTQSMAPAWRTLPDGDNGFAALSLYIAPRLTLTENWALFADTTVAYEQTQPDDQASRNKVQSLDTRFTLLGNLATFGGVTLTGGPRLIIPTSRPSWAARTVGTAAVANFVRPFDVLEGLAILVGGAYTHFFSPRTTREATGDTSDVSLCTNTRGGIDNCPVSSTAITQDAFRVIGSVTLNVSAAWSLQTSYIYSWSLAKKLPDAETVVIGDLGEVPIQSGESEIGHDTSRFRRLGSFTLGVNYQPADWLIATLSGNTTVCYYTDAGSNSATGGCAAGVAWNGFWDKNPIANRFSQLSLSFTLPIDAVYLRLTRKSVEARGTAREQTNNQKKLAQVRRHGGTLQ